MKTLKTLSTILLFVILSFSTNAQDWIVNGNTNAQLGGSLNPSIGTNGNRPILFETNNIIRMQLTQTNTSTINGFTVNNSGFLGLSVPLAATLLSQKLTSADASIPSAL